MDHKQVKFRRGQRARIFTSSKLLAWIFVQETTLEYKPITTHKALKCDDFDDVLGFDWISHLELFFGGFQVEQESENNV